MVDIQAMSNRLFDFGQRALVKSGNSWVTLRMFSESKIGDGVVLATAF